jgi:hypothetical protein
MNSESEALQFEKTHSPDGGDNEKSIAELPVSSTEVDTTTPDPLWTSIIRLLADAEPRTAAGVAGVLVVIVLFVFGRVGSLIVGVFTGLLLHASLEKRQVTTPSREIFQFHPEKEHLPDREVGALYICI